jgi:hypothetical protein
MNGGLPNSNDHLNPPGLESAKRSEDRDIGAQPLPRDVVMIMDASVQARLGVIDASAKPVSHCATRKQRNNHTLDNA